MIGMRQKARLFTAFLVTLTFLFWLVGLSTKNAICKLETPEVNVIPSEAQVAQQVLVEATINIAVC